MSFLFKFNYQVCHQLKHEDLPSRIIGLCIKIHKELGPGLLESVYEEAICYELAKNNNPFKRQQGIRVRYDNVEMGIGFRADVIVDNKVLLEVKSVDIVPPVYYKILLTYLRFSIIDVGLLINFQVLILKDGISRLIYDKKSPMN